MEIECCTCALHAGEGKATVKIFLLHTQIAPSPLPQETKFKEAAGFYEAIVKKNFDNVSAG